MSQVSVVLFMVVVGGLIALQGAVNSALGKFLEHPIHAAIVSFSTGLLALFVASFFLKSGLPTFSKILTAPKIILIGGLLGSVFVTSVILCVPKIGVASVILAALCGQVILSLILDHFGAFGVPKQPVDFKRICGALLVISGLVLINWRK
ncbi:MAG: DMT family transporter [Lentisphaeraceae bacterium]|nr:DMT family transporter [Lentisphaeraceae bacterium]